MRYILSCFVILAIVTWMTYQGARQTLKVVKDRNQLIETMCDEVIK